MPRVLALALLSMAARLHASHGICRGYGNRLSSRITAIPASAPISVTGSQPATRTQAALQRLYSSFVDTALRGFRGAALLDSSEAKPAFESEVEHWVSSFSGDSSPQQQQQQQQQPLWSGLLNHSRVLDESSTNATISVASATNAARNVSVANQSDVSVGGSVGSAVAAIGGVLHSCLGLLHSSLMSKIDARPPSFARVPPHDQWNRIVILSGGDRNAALSDRVVANHAAFASRNGYAYWWHRGSLVAPLGWQPYWHKVAMLRRATLRFPTATAFVWLDDDVVLTNFATDDMLRAALGRSNASILATRDPANWATLNTGVLLVRNDEDGREALEEVWRRATAPRADGVSLAFDSQDTCLHEQQALQEMLHESHWRSRIAVLAQRVDEDDAYAAERASHPVTLERPAFNLNTFLRWSHFNAERSSNMRFDHDAHGSGWVRGDFAGHCSGLSSVRRALCVSVLLGSVVTT